MLKRTTMTTPSRALASSLVLTATLLGLVGHALAQQPANAPALNAATPAAAVTVGDPRVDEITKLTPEERASEELRKALRAKAADLTAQNQAALAEKEL